MGLTSPQSYGERLDKLIVKFVTHVKSKKIINLAGSTWLANELQACGVNAIYFPLSTLDTKKMKSFNANALKNIDFLSYVPLRRFSFYGGNEVINLAKLFPQYKFALIMPDIAKKDDLPKSPYSNLRLYPKLSFGETQLIYQMSKCFIRLTEHDGLSLSVLEALYYKLQVIWSYDYSYVTHVNAHDIVGLKKAAIKIMENFELNQEGSDFVIQNFSIEGWKARMQKLIKKVVDTA
jgi:hypothetical protein